MTVAGERTNCYDDYFTPFKTFVFKVCTARDIGEVSESIRHGLQNDIVESNKARVMSAIQSIFIILQNITEEMKQNVFVETQHSLIDISANNDGNRTTSAISEKPMNIIRGMGSADCLPDQVNKGKETLKDEDDECSALSSDLVQITADKVEIDRRISAFIEKQRVKVNFANIQEFCGGARDQDNSCARVDAVFKPRAGSKSHIVVKRVVNRSGPQTAPMSTHMTAAVSMCHSSMNIAPDIPVGIGGEVGGRTRKSLPVGIEERLLNMEAHLDLPRKVQSTHEDLYERLHRLESKILEIESQSPEYFHFTSQHDRAKRRRIDSCVRPLLPGDTTSGSCSDIDKRIDYLRRALERKLTTSIAPIRMT